VDENKIVAERCQKISALKRQAVNLFRQEGTSGYKAQAEKFVQDNWLPELLLAPPADVEKPTTELEKRQFNLLAFNNAYQNYCRDFQGLVENVANQTAEETMLEVNRSQIMVEGMLGEVYSDGRYKKASAVLKAANQDISALTKQFVRDPKQQKEIVDGYQKLNLFWPKKPQPSDYQKNAQGIAVLDQTKFSAGAKVTDGNVFETFSDPALSFFTTINADYVPVLTMGKNIQAERVNMMPMFLGLMENNPFTFMAITAHEAGHKIGPEISRINGYDLTSEYKNLLSCLGERQSIYMQKGQEDEAIADYISAEVLARQLGKLPQDKRRQAMMSAMESFCIFDQMDFGVDCKGTHPENSLRVNGIYAANPNLRSILGCQGPSSQFKNCGQEQLTLPGQGGK
jgi:hypothetical protein